MELIELPSHVLEQVLDNLDTVSLNIILDSKDKRISDLALISIKKRKDFGEFFYMFRSKKINRKIIFTQTEATVWDLSEKEIKKMRKVKAKDVIIEFNSISNRKKAVEAHKKGLNYLLKKDSTLADLSEKEFVKIFSALDPNGPWKISIGINNFLNVQEKIYRITVFDSS